MAKSTELITIWEAPIVYEELSEVDKGKYKACLKLYLGYMFDVMKKEEAETQGKSDGSNPGNLPDHLFFV
jgi:hypothetical protein